MAERAIPESSRGPAAEPARLSGAGGDAIEAPRPVPPPVTLAPPPDEAVRRAGLVKMKRVATGLLVVAAVVFVVARVFEPRYPWLGYVRATAEAAMVGGLADWFAVTALFRHPMGLPIPHTAIIPTRKDRVGRSLGGFVQRHFLAREVITARLSSLRMAERLATWLAQPENARLIARQVTMGLAGGARLLRDEDVQHWIDQSLGARVRAIQIAPLLGRILALVTEGDRHQELLNAAIRLLARAVTDNRDFIRHRIEEESPWWVPGAVDDRIHEKVVGAMERTIAEVRDDPAHPLRLRFDAALHDFIDKLQTSPDVQARAEALKLEVLDAEAVRHFSGS
ncbi:MAG TPA: DUF445 domain-containing protein, partial [Gemmatimonadaceae bacterium]|nr:DUF445 domain-containing protein [Gemmatimonadaceae bacterium]